MDRKQKLAAIALSLTFLYPVAHSCAQAASPSLFFTAQEASEINRAHGRLPQAQASRPVHLLRLDSILFFSPSQWSVWLQGKKWTPNMRDDRITIQEVGRDYVRLKALLENGRIVEKARLELNQSLNLLTGEIQ